MKDSMIDSLSLAMPDLNHETEYCRIMDKWETIEKNIQPELMSRYSKKLGGNMPFTRWLECCEDDRTTGSMLSTHVPCTLYFLTNPRGEILGGIAINHAITNRGHLHAGIVPWYRCMGYGTAQLKLALSQCLKMGIQKVQITPRKDNLGAIQTIVRNGGVLVDEFCDDNTMCLRYEIDALIYRS